MTTQHICNDCNLGKVYECNNCNWWYCSTCDDWNYKKLCEDCFKFKTKPKKRGKLSIQKTSSVTIELKTETCSIYLEDLGKKNVVTFPCHHTHKIHFNCLLSLRYHYNKQCPLCRTLHLTPRHRERDIYNLSSDED